MTGFSLIILSEPLIGHFIIVPPGLNIATTSSSSQTTAVVQSGEARVGAPSKVGLFGPVQDAEADPLVGLFKAPSSTNLLVGRLNVTQDVVVHLVSVVQQLPHEFGRHAELLVLLKISVSADLPVGQLLGSPDQDHDPADWLVGRLRGDDDAIEFRAIHVQMVFEQKKQTAIIVIAGKENYI